MTVIEEAKKNEIYWHEAFEKAIGRDSAKVLALLYLAMGEDYAYNMVKQFKKLSIGSKALMDQAQLQPILKDLEEKGFLTSKYHTVDGRERKNFSVNIKVLRSPTGSRFYHLPGTSMLDIADDYIESLLTELGQKDRRQYFSQFKSISKFDFITLLVILKEEARMQYKSNVELHFAAYISEIERLERDRRRVEPISYEMDLQKQ